MHNAPSVTYPVGRSFWAGLWVGTIWALGVIALAAWTVQRSGADWLTGMAWGGCLATGAWAAAAWWRSPTGELQWCGTAWWWSDAHGNSTQGALVVGLDLQRLLLVHWRSGGASAWFWLERGHAPVHWPALRRAVYSPANPDGLQGAEPPSAIP